MKSFRMNAQTLSKNEKMCYNRSCEWIGTRVLARLWVTVREETKIPSETKAPINTRSTPICEDIFLTVNEALVPSPLREITKPSYG